MATNEKDMSFLEALSLLAKEKGIEPDLLVEKIKTAVSIAVKKEYPKSENIVFNIDEETGSFNVSLAKEITKEIEDEANQITPEQAKKYMSKPKVGEMCEIPLDTKHFGRIAAQTAKHP